MKEESYVYWLVWVIEGHLEGKSDNMEDMASGGGGYNNYNRGGATRSSGEVGGRWGLLLQGIRG